jgi:hypothetical protein
MSAERKFNKEAFLYLSKASGLNTDDPHMDQLFAYLEEVLPKLKGADESAPISQVSDGKDLHTFIRRFLPPLKRLDQLNLVGLDPAIIFTPPRREKDEQ